MDEAVNQRLKHIALVVADYDDAIRFYREKLNFRLDEDTVLSYIHNYLPHLQLQVLFS